MLSSNRQWSGQDSCRSHQTPSCRALIVATAVVLHETIEWPPTRVQSERWPTKRKSFSRLQAPSSESDCFRELDLDKLMRMRDCQFKVRRLRLIQQCAPPKQGMSPVFCFQGRVYLLLPPITTAVHKVDKTYVLAVAQHFHSSMSTYRSLSKHAHGRKI